MARSYAPIVLSVWRNDDFLRLDTEAQRLYLLLISQPNIDYCGVIPYMPSRWSKLANNSTAARIRRAAADLEQARFITIDMNTEELWVRSFVKHNGVLSQPNVAKAMRSAFEHIASLDIRQQFYVTLPIDEQKRLPSPFPPNDPNSNGKPEPKQEGQMEGQGLPQPLPQAEGQAQALAPTRGLGSKDQSFDLDLDLDLLPNPKPEPEQSSSSPTQPEPDDDGPPAWATLEAERQADLPRRPSVPPIHDRTAWLAEAARRAWRQHGATVACWLTDEPNLTDADIAQRLAQATTPESDEDRYRRLAEEVFNRSAS